MTRNLPIVDPLRASARSLPAALLCLLLAGAGGAGAQSGATLLLSNGVEPVTQLVIGDDLFLGLSGATPGAAYLLVLADEADEVVASATVIADAAGSVAPTLVWMRSGVVGCDPEADPDPLAYRFASFEQAEQILADREFHAAAVESSSSLEAVSSELDLVVDADDPRFFLADGSGCPRWSMSEEESVYLGAVHHDPDAMPLVRLFLVAPMPWTVGSPLNDLRAEYPEGQLIPLPPSGPGLPVPAWTSPEGDTDVCPVVRPNDLGPGLQLGPSDKTVSSAWHCIFIRLMPDEPTDCIECRG